jgi:hypothetical protein
MSLSPVAHDPSVAEDGDTSPAELGRKMRERPYANALYPNGGEEHESSISSNEPCRERLRSRAGEAAIHW